MENKIILFEKYKDNNVIPIIINIDKEMYNILKENKDEKIIIEFLDCEIEIIEFLDCEIEINEDDGIYIE